MADAACEPGGEHVEAFVVSLVKSAVGRVAADVAPAPGSSTVTCTGCAAASSSSSSSDFEALLVQKLARPAITAPAHTA